MTLRELIDRDPSLLDARVLGTLPRTADGAIVGHTGVIHPFHPLDDEDSADIRIKFYVRDSDSGEDLIEDDELDISKCYSTRAAADAARRAT